MLFILTDYMYILNSITKLSTGKRFKATNLFLNSISLAVFDKLKFKKN